MDTTYKKYSLEKLEEWMHDSMSCDETTPQDIFNVIKGVVEENYYYHKHHTGRAYELLALLNGNGQSYEDVIKKMSDLLNINVKDSAKYIYESPDGGKTVYRRKFGENPTNRELVNVDTINSHSEHYYDYTRNDENRKNPFVDKVVKWVLPVEVDGPSGEYFVTFPDDLMEASGLEEGNTVEWVDNGDGSYLIRKV